MSKKKETGVPQTRRPCFCMQMQFVCMQLQLFVMQIGLGKFRSRLSFSEEPTFTSL